ncbi:MAG: putative toxin-antitoxin system toxin component, PIN family [Firmicutes bacterium]|nr:putative toxin-antitoxin system toxin component, PIN family [Bacillota bacterium]
MKYYAVMDTNVLVSSMLKKDSIPGRLLDYVLEGEIILLLNNEILNEYKEVLLRNEFGFEETDINELIVIIREKGIFLDRTRTDEVFSDADDIVFYEIVLTGRKTTDAYLVTGNLKHFPVKPFVVTPKEMLSIIHGA